MYTDIFILDYPLPHNNNSSTENGKPADRHSTELAGHRSCDGFPMLSASRCSGYIPLLLRDVHPGTIRTANC